MTTAAAIFPAGPQLLDIDAPAALQDLIALRNLIRRVAQKRHASVTVSTDGAGVLTEHAAEESYQFEERPHESAKAREAREADFLADVWARYREHPGNVLRVSCHSGRLTIFVERRNDVDQLLRIEQQIGQLAQQLAAFQQYMQATAQRPEAAAVYELDGREFTAS